MGRAPRFGLGRESKDNLRAVFGELPMEATPNRSETVNDLIWRTARVHWGGVPCFDNRSKPDAESEM